MRYAPVWLFQVCNASNTWPSDASSIVFCQLMQHKVASRSPYGRRRLSNSKWRRRGRKLNCAPNLRKWRVSRGAFMRRTAEAEDTRGEIWNRDATRKKADSSCAIAVEGNRSCLSMRTPLQLRKIHPQFQYH